MFYARADKVDRGTGHLHDLQMHHLRDQEAEGSCAEWSAAGEGAPAYCIWNRCDESITGLTKANSPSVPFCRPGASSTWTPCRRYAGLRIWPRTARSRPSASLSLKKFVSRVRPAERKAQAELLQSYLIFGQETMHNSIPLRRIQQDQCHWHARNLRAPLNRTRLLFLYYTDPPAGRFPL